MTQETEYERSGTSHRAGRGREGWVGGGGGAGRGRKREVPGDREEVETQMRENHKTGKRERQYCNI